MLAGRLPPGSHKVTPGAPRHPVASLAERRPDIPRELDDLIAHATHPDLPSRLASAREFTEALARISVTNTRAARVRMPIGDASGWMLVIGLAAALGAGAFAVYGRHAALPDPGRVVVADFANETGLPALDRVGEQAGDIVAAALSRAPGLTVINAVVALGVRQRSPSPRADSALLSATMALVRDTHAGVVVTGSYYAEGAQLAVLAEVTDTRSGRILGVVGPMGVDSARADRGLQAIADSVVGVVRHRFAPPAGGG
jgi:TolB-like protein